MQEAPWSDGDHPLPLHLHITKQGCLYFDAEWATEGHWWFDALLLAIILPIGVICWLFPSLKKLI